MVTLLRTEADVLDLTQSILNEVCDPCGLARGLSIGMVDMGLVRDIKILPIQDGWTVALKIRFTNAGCLYFPYFEREIRSRLKSHSQIETLSIEWDDVLDWTPDDLSDAAKSKLKEHSDQLLTTMQ